MSALPNGLIRFLVVFAVREGTGHEAGHAFCNRVNDGLIVVRAGMHDPTTLLVDWYLPVSGGITRRAVVLAFRQFMDLLGMIAQYDHDDILA